MRRLKQMLMLVGIVASSVIGSMPSSVRAQNGTGLEISPVRSDVVVEPGSSTTVKIRLTNNVVSPVRARLAVNDFTPQENGEAQLQGDDVQGPTSIKDFVGKLDDTVIEPTKSVNVEVPISVPEAQAPGVYYGVLRFDALSANETSPEALTGVTLGASLGYVLIVEVPGSSSESMSITKVLPERNGSVTRLLAASPSSINVTVSNNGQTLLKPYGTVQVFNFRNKEVLSLGVNDGDIKTNVLPQNKRVLKAEIKDKNLLPGRYKVVTTLAYGQNNETTDFTTTFWVLPPVFIVIVAVVLVLIFVAIGLAIRRLKAKTTRHRR